MLVPVAGWLGLPEGALSREEGVFPNVCNFKPEGGPDLVPSASEIFRGAPAQGATMCAPTPTPTPAPTEPPSPAPTVEPTPGDEPCEDELSKKQCQKVKKGKCKKNAEKCRATCDLCPVGPTPAPTPGGDECSKKLGKSCKKDVKKYKKKCKGEKASSEKCTKEAE